MNIIFILFKWFHYIYIDVINQKMFYFRYFILYNADLIGIRVRVVMFIATVNNNSVLSWQSVLLVEETEVPRENHQPAANH